MDSEHVPIKRSRTRSSEQSGLLDRSIVQKWSKEELQERFLTLYHDHSQQKEKIRDQEDANKNLKLVLTKTQEKMRHLQSQSGAGAAEIRATDQVVKLEMRLVELEKQNAQLLGRATLKAAQAPTGAAQPAGSPKRRGGYRGVSSNSRLHNRSLSSSIGGGGAGGAEGEAQRLRREVESLREQLDLKDMELRNAAKDVSSERDSARMQAGGSQLLSMQDDLERVRLQRQLREKAAIVDQLQIRCETLDERVRDLQTANATLMQTVEQARLATRMRDQEAAASIGSEAMGQATQKRLLQMEHALEDARAEAQVLRESNEKLVNSAFDIQKERQWRLREMALMAQIRQLEAGRGSTAAFASAPASAEGFTKVRIEPGLGGGDSDMELELSNLRVRYYDLQLKHEALQERLSAIDYRKRGISDDEFHAALSLVRRQQESAELQPSDLIFLKSSSASQPAAGAGTQQRRLLELEVAHADTVAELDKARELLKAQQLLAADTKAGHSLTEFRLQEVRAEYEARIAELNRLLQIRADRIRQLEEQLARRANGAPAKSSGVAEEPQVMPRQQRQAQQAPSAVQSTKPSKASPAASVAEELCVERIQGVAESAYRERHRADATRPASAEVVSAMASRLDAPPDCPLAESTASSDNESVHSVVPEPVRLAPRESAPDSYFTKETIKLVVDAKIRDLGGDKGRQGGSSLPPPPPYDEPSYGRPDSEQSKTAQHPRPEPRKKLQPQADQRQVEQEKAESTPASVVDEDEEDREADASDTDSTVVVVTERPKAADSRLQTAAPAAAVAAPDIVNQCFVQVLELHLNPDSEALANNELDDTGCYVAFGLPGYDCEDTETPLSIRTPRPGIARDSEYTLRYNFRRAYDYNFDTSYDKRHQLARAMLLRDQPTLNFSVVCEALDGSDFFLDLARAELPLRDLIKSQRQAPEETLNLVSKGEIIGTLKVATDLPALLRAIAEELPPSVKKR